MRLTEVHWVFLERLVYREPPADYKKIINKIGRSYTYVDARGDVCVLLGRAGGGRGILAVLCGRDGLGGGGRSSSILTGGGRGV